MIRFFKYLMAVAAVMFSVTSVFAQATIALIKPANEVGIRTNVQTVADKGDTAFSRFIRGEVKPRKAVKPKTRVGKAKAKPRRAKRTASSTRTKTKGSGRRYSNLIKSYANKYGVPVSLAHAVVQVESNYRVNARGRAGEIGLMQIKLATARMMGYKGSRQALYKPENNLRYGMKYLGKARRLAGGNTCGTILRYNAGLAARKMNPISRRYCQKVHRHLR